MEPDDPMDIVREKVKAIFTELAGKRGDSLFAISPKSVMVPLTRAFQQAGKNVDEEVAYEAAFHMVDWNEDAAFLVALHLFPERFTTEEIEGGLGLFLAH